MADSSALDELFEQALSIESAEERLQFMIVACRGDARLLEDLQSLVAASERPSILEQFRNEITTQKNSSQSRIKTAQVGPYRILRSLGQGGMGTVLLGEQETPIKRKVALKLIRPDFLNRETIWRFEQEHKTLAQLEHPGIARVLDIGKLPDDRTWIAMEYVEGLTLTDYCTQKKVRVRERLELFLQCCLAVQHVHQRAIIHRDIKPSNVLVTIVDGAAIIKLIDFGVAKQLQRQETQSQLMNTMTITGLHSIPGTPAYMSPEQLMRGNLPIDTRCDVYSLGALLYAILTDRSPYADSLNKAQNFEDIRRIIVDADPQLPGKILQKRVSGSADDGLSSPIVQAQELQGDLDCIVLKAMSKEPARRYQTVGDLMVDIQNHLDHKPVTARPASVAYQLTRFAKRHQRPLLAVTGAISCLVVGLIAALVQANRAIRSEQQMAERSYASDMLLASMAIQKQDSFEVTRKLERYLPQPGETDRRSFDWHLLNRMNSFRAKTISQQEDAVYFLCPLKLSPEVASCGVAGIIRIHHLETGAIRLKIAAGQGEVNGLSVSPDGQLLASAGDDGTIRIWNLSNGEQTGVFQAHKRQAFQVAWSADGQWMATCGNEVDVKLWSARDFSLLETLSSDGKDLECLAVSASGDVAFGAEHGALTVIRPKFLETKPGDQLQQTGGTHRKKGPPGHCSNVAFSPTGSMIVAGREDGSVTLQSMLEEEPFFQELHFNDRVKSIAFSPDGQKLAIGKIDGLVTVIPLESTLLKKELKLSELLTDTEGNPATLNSSSVQGEPFLVRSTPVLQNGRLPAGTNQVQLEFSEPLSAANVSDHYSLQTKRLFGDESAVSIVPPSNVVVRGNTIVLSFPEGTLHTDWEEQSQELTGRTWKVGDAHIASLCFSGDGSSLVVADENSHIQTLTGLEDSNTSEIATDVEDFAAADNGRMVILKNDFSSSLVDLSVGDENKRVDVKFVSHRLQMLRFGFSDNGEQLFFLSGDESDPDAVVLRWQGSATKPEVVWKPTPQESLRHYLGCFESRWLVLDTQPREQPSNAPGAKADIVLVDLKDNKEVSRVSGLVSVYRAISRDGRIMIRSAHDGIYFHDLRRGTLIATLPNSKPSANGIAISADDSKVAIAYSERILRIYRTSDAALLREVKLQGGAISDLAWTSDGKTLVSISFDGFLRCWSSELLELTTLFRLPTEDPDKLALSENGRSAIILDRSGRLYRVQAN
ncbi:MAG: WD40 repeat domain-containing serine/threonine-protein kinase [Planctomycetales bacterium]|nr:WD40 repeat domain-containing serine/threonine-protein kinase [Planctomycetales bacterium]